MNSKTIAFLFGSALLLLGTACGGGNDDDTPPTYNEFLTSYSQLAAEGFCKVAFECISEAPELLTLTSSTQEECVAWAASDIQAYDDISEAVAAKRITYNASQAQDCLTDLQALLDTSACNIGSQIGNDTFFSRRSCETVLQGTLAEEAPCTMDDECQSGLECESSNEEDICYGTCVPQPCNDACSNNQYCKEGETREEDECVKFLAKGESCVFSSECGAGLKCGAQSICEEEEEDAPIILRDMGEVCDLGATSWCKQGLTCVDFSFATERGVCGPPRNEGEECLFFECRIDLVCTQGTCTKPLTNGGSCEVDSDCISLNCNDEGICTEVEACMLP